jgi:hypothetical protein
VSFSNFLAVYNRRRGPLLLGFAVTVESARKTRRKVFTKADHSAQSAGQGGPEGLVGSGPPGANVRAGKFAPRRKPLIFARQRFSCCFSKASAIHAPVNVGPHARAPLVEEDFFQRAYVLCKAAQVKLQFNNLKSCAALLACSRAWSRMKPSERQFTKACRYVGRGRCYG